MGGDNAPEEIVAGTILAHNAGLGTMTLVGDRQRIAPLLAAANAGAIEIVHSDGQVAMDEHPSRALRIADQTSLGVAVNLVRDGLADAVVSAGNSGAFLAVALIRLRTIAGISRPAIATTFPGLKGPTLMLDAGANVDCRPEWLLQFGMMGSAYAKAVFKYENPRVAIVSVGEERTKGNAQAIEAATLLDSAPVNFVGNIEGKDILYGAADVVVTDGFVGNVILKVSEGAASALSQVMRDMVKRGSIFVKIGALMMMPELRRMRKRYSYEAYGGAPLLGLSGNCIVAHGRSNREAIKNACRVAAIEVQEDVVGKIRELVSPLVAKEA